MLDKQILADMGSAIAKLVPAAAIAWTAPSLAFYLQALMYFLGSLYLVQQIAYLSWKKRRESKLPPKSE